MSTNQKSQQPQSQMGDRIERMFSGIAPWYDFLNRLLSGRQDVVWRRELVQGLRLSAKARVLDLAAGTLDVALEIIRQKPDCLVMAADFSLAMLQKGREKLLGHRAAGAIWPIVADAFSLPFSNSSFEALTIAFGVRNLPDRGAALREMYRVLRPGGVAAILEFIPPESGFLQTLYKLYLNGVLPVIGRLFSQHAFAYKYLAESIQAFPAAGAFCQQLCQAGFRKVEYRSMTFGVVYFFYGQKPGEG